MSEAETVQEQEQEQQPDSGWAPPLQEPKGLKGKALEEWRQVLARVRETASRLGLSKSEVARRADMSSGTLSSWYNGNYSGDYGATGERLRSWLDALEESDALRALLPAAPAYVETKIGRKVWNALLFAQTMPAMAVVTLGAGGGKTHVARRYVDTHAHAYIVTMRPTTSSVHTMLLTIADALDVVEKNPARLDKAIGQRLKRNGRNTLLIVDEAQNLGDNAVNELRYLLDGFGCGLALLGNEELYTRFGGERPTPAYAQIHRRIGMRVRQMMPDDADLKTFVAAWGVTDRKAAALAQAIGHKPGGFAQISQTLMLAHQIAAADGREIGEADIKAAWRNRGGEAV